ncbi:uncharacterized protein LOC108667438 [Hyalella azteca]|uniref:Uncharacterized protein LOC108667438 n=1 Tax=Hyalella azteca TaxID=294128 RepID=A0A8B7N7Y5_HYAAZ|nr:uncharacterized protein LOC108667438 [Hyalella azteca]
MAPVTKDKVDSGKKNKNSSKASSGRVSKNYQSKNSVLKGTNVWKEVPDESEISKKDEAKALFTINEKGQKIKQFKKQGVSRPWLDVKYKENERMTFYDGFYVKRESVAELDKLKRSLELEGHGGEKVKKMMMKPLRKANRVLFKELLYEEKFKQIKDGTYTAPVKVWSKKDCKNKQQTSKESKSIAKKIKGNESKSKEEAKNDAESGSCGKNSRSPDKRKKAATNKAIGSSIPSIAGLDLNFQISDNEASDDEREGSQMDYNGVPHSFVETKINAIDESDDSCNTDDEDDEGINICKSKKQMSSKSSVEENTEAMESADEGVESDDEVTDTMNANKSLKLIYSKASESSIEMKENELMTCVEGIWIRRCKIGAIADWKDTVKKNIIASRTDGNTSTSLSEEENLKFKSALKVELNKLSNQLMAYLRRVAKKHSSKTLNKGKKTKKCRLHRSERKALKTGTGAVNKFQKSNESKLTEFRGVEKKTFNPVRTKNGLVNFRGYWIKPEGAKRLHELENKLKAEGTAKERIAELIKVERRREENELKRERRQVCFSCRKTGHMVADCPLKRNVQGVGSCFKCGSLEHQSDTCSEAQFSYATCFICRQKGHISRECPKNTKGLYPHGGGCTLCDSNQHLIKDCPRNTEEQKERPELKAGVLKAGQLLEVMEDATPVTPSDSANVTKKKKNKVVKF